MGRPANTEKDKIENTSITNEKEKKNEKNELFDIQEVLKAMKMMQDKINSLEDTLQEKDEEIEATKYKSAKTLDDDVTIVFNMYGTLRAKFPSWELKLTRFGQEMTITKRQFQELVNSKRSYFDKQYILLSSKYMDLAEENQVNFVDKDSNKYFKYSDIKLIADMSVYQLEEYYNNLSDPMKKIFLTFYLNKCYEEDPKYYKVENMNALNRFSNGSLFDNLIRKCSSQNL